MTKPLILIVMFLVIAAGAEAVLFPYPLYGYTEPKTKVTVTSSLGKMSQVSDKNGYFQFELNSEVKSINLKIKTCNKAITLPEGGGYRVDMVCGTGSNVLYYAGGSVLTLAAVIAAIRAAKKKPKAKKK